MRRVSQRDSDARRAYRIAIARAQTYKKTWLFTVMKGVIKL